MSKRTIGADGLDELPGNEVEDAPVWHAIVGDGWEPVQFREIAQPDEEVLLASGWINASPYGGGFVYGPEHKPRRRRKRRRMVTWRLCAFLRTPLNDSGYICMSRKVEWIQSDRIEAPWCALEAQTNPFETVKTLPEGEEP